MSKDCRDEDKRKEGDIMLKKRLVALTLIFLLSWGLNIFAQKVTMPPEDKPKLAAVKGTTDAILGPAKYPDFYNYSSDNPTCGNYLRDTLSGQACTVKSQHGSDGYVTTEGISCRTKLDDLKGLKISNFTLPANYRNSMLLITWTVRIEGYKPGTVVVWPNLCDPWHGTSYQSFPGGKVRSRLVLNGKPVGDVCTMTIPDGGKAEITNESDPTLTCSAVVDAKDLSEEGNTFKVQWKNDTSLRLVSPANMRNLVIMVFPKER